MTCQVSVLEESVGLQAALAHSFRVDDHLVPGSWVLGIEMDRFPLCDLLTIVSRQTSSIKLSGQCCYCGKVYWDDGTATAPPTHRCIDRVNMGPKALALAVQMSAGSFVTSGRRFAVELTTYLLRRDTESQVCTPSVA